MGASFCTVFETNVPPHGSLGSDHPALLRRQRKLDRLAVDHGLTPLGAFESYSPDDVADFMDEDAADELPPAQWFAASTGLAAIHALLAHLATHPDAVRGQADVVADLRSLEEELADAERLGVRFRFAVVP
jgi:hypothetical protein